MAEQLIKAWDRWDGGVGQQVEQEGTNGFSGPIGLTSPSLVGLPGLLRPPPGRIDLGDFTAGYTLRNGFQEKDAAGYYHLYLLSNSATAGRVNCLSLESQYFGYEHGNIAFANTVIGHPVRYRGYWYFTGINDHANARLMRQVTTVPTALTATVAGDFTAGDANSGDGHLALIGHQMAKIERVGGASILTTDASALVDANWGAEFPVGDGLDFPYGLASLQGLMFALKGKGLYTFNDRGRSGLVFEDLAAWQGASTPWWGIAPWKGGLVFTHKSGIYFYQLGSLPIYIGPNREKPDSNTSQIPFSSLEYRAVSVIGDYLYTWAYSPLAAKAWLLCAQFSGSMERLNWSIIQALSTTQDDSGIVITTDSTEASVLTATHMWYQIGTNIMCSYLSDAGAPWLPTGSVQYAQTGASALMSALTFPTNVHLTKLVVILENMVPANSEKFQMSLTVNASSNVNIGGPISSNDRHEIRLDYDNVYKAQIGATYTDAGTAGGPLYLGGGISRIELWGETGA